LRYDLRTATPELVQLEFTEKRRTAEDYKNTLLQQMAEQKNRK